MLLLHSLLLSLLSPVLRPCLCPCLCLCSVVLSFSSVSLLLLLCLSSFSSASLLSFLLPRRPALPSSDPLQRGGYSNGRPGGWGTWSGDRS